MGSLISLLMTWWIFSLIFPRWISNPIPIVIGIIKRIIRSITRAIGRQVWWHIYGKQEQHRGKNHALQHLILCWNVFATVVIVYALSNHDSRIDAQQAIPGLMIFWIGWFLYRQGHKKWQKYRSPKRRLPGRHR